MLMEVEHERRKEREQLERDEASRQREMDDYLRHVEESRREKAGSCSPMPRAFALVCFCACATSLCQRRKAVAD